MSGGTFRGVVSGTWETTRGGWLLPAAVAGAGIAAGGAVMSALAALLWALLVLAVVAIAVIVFAIVWMRRWTGREYQRFGQQLAALPDEPRPAVTAPQQVINNFHGGTHVHMLPGSPLPLGIDEHGQVIQAFPLRDGITETGR